MAIRTKALCCTISLALACGGCAAPQGSLSSSEDNSFGPRREACGYNVARGAALGAILGAITGAAADKNRGEGALIGGVIGGLAGGGITAYLQDRCEALRTAKAEMSSADLDYSTIQVPTSGTDNRSSNSEDTGVFVTARDRGMFDTGSAALTQGGRADMTRLARIFSSGSRPLLVVGHTDSTGRWEENQKLSERRAATVARLFEQNGIPATRLYFKGAGDTEPVDTNETEQGRAHNRRVDVIELSNEGSIVAYNQLVQSDPHFLQRRMESHVPTALPTVSTARPAPSPQTNVQTAFVKALPAIRGGTRFDFGGGPVTGTGAPIASYVGARDSTAGGSWLNELIPQAMAATARDEPLLNTACIADHSLSEIEVKSLATGQAVSREIGNYMPGLYGSSWSQTLNGNLVGLTGVSVLEDGGRVDLAPSVLVFAGYHAGDTKPSLSAKAKARAYVGEKGVLYRAFVDNRGWPLRCIDIVFSRSDSARTAYGRLYYDKQGHAYAVNFQADHTGNR